MKNNTLINTFITLFLALVYCISCVQTTPDDRPNILFIMSDDHGYQAISAYGSGIITTPNIDRLASEGMIFDRCYVNNSICAPSRAAILTGKHSHINGVLDNHHQAFDGFQPTMFTKDHKLIHYYTTGEWELFDRQKDPLEINSVYNDPVYADIKDTMAKELQELRHYYNVPSNTFEKTEK